ncbi:MAG: type II secretion system GspH family protein [Muribaculaceae bacterium]|nr:type II secretion system GspH family protein [Muribaculaceae bacterium]
MTTRLQDYRHPERSEGSHNIKKFFSRALPQNDENKNTLSRCERVEFQLEQARKLEIRERVKKAAFTLAEVLITLGIIGVVAAMTIPNIAANVKAKKLQSKYMKVYSTLTNLTRVMQNDDIGLDYRSYSYGQLARTMQTYLPGSLIAMTYSSKYPFWHPGIDENKEHRSLDGTKTGSSYFDDGQIALSDGTNLFIENAGPRALYYLITADINGVYTPPNRLGYDLFTFQLMQNGELRPMGTQNTYYTDMSKYCNINIKSNINGIACAAKALNDPDYFKWAVKNIK